MPAAQLEEGEGVGLTVAAGKRVADDVPEGVGVPVALEVGLIVAAEKRVADGVGVTDALDVPIVAAGKRVADDVTEGVSVPVALEVGLIVAAGKLVADGVGVTDALDVPTCDEHAVTDAVKAMPPKT